MITLKSGHQVRLKLTSKQTRHGSHSSTREAHNPEPIGVDELLQTVRREATAMGANAMVEVTVLAWNDGPLARIETDDYGRASGFARVDAAKPELRHFTDRDAWISAVEELLRPLASEHETLLQRVDALERRIAALESAPSRKGAA